MQTNNQLMYKYHKEPNELREQASKPRPLIRRGTHPENKELLKEYNQYIASLRTIPCSPQCRDVWEDEQLFKDGEFELMQTDCCELNCTSDWCKSRGCQNPTGNSFDKFTAYPVQQEESEDDYDKYIEELQVKVDRDLRDHGASSKEVYDAIQWAATLLKHSFTIHRKQ